MKKHTAESLYEMMQPLSDYCAFIVSATANCTALEMEAERACMLTAMRGCFVEVAG